MRFVSKSPGQEEEGGSHKKKKRKKQKKNGRENLPEHSKRDGQLSAAAYFSKARELFTDAIIKEKKQIPEPG